MRCHQIVRLLGAYLDGELSLNEKKKVRDHLAECTRCNWEFESLTRVKDMVSKVEVRMPERLESSDYWREIAQKLERPSWWDRWKEFDCSSLIEPFLVYPRFALGTGLAAAAIISVLILNPFSGPKKSPLLPVSQVPVPLLDCEVDSVETNSPGSTVMIFKKDNTTVIWIYGLEEEEKEKEEEPLWKKGTSL